jgi:ParB-like chromosome segregation protein Spo0J
MNLKINPEYASLVSPLSDAEYQALKQSIEKHGLHFPVVINTRDEILDGHNRYRVCQELGIEPLTEVKFFDNPEEEKIFVIEANLKRRQLSEIERIDLVRKLEPIEAELAKHRQLAHLKAGKGAPISPSVSNEDNRQSGRVNDIMAEKAGVSPTTYYKAKTVLEEASEAVKEKVKSGDMSINEGFKQVRPQKQNRKSKEAKDVVMLPSSLFSATVTAIEEAKRKSLMQLALRTDGHKILFVGDEMEVTID